MFILIDPFFWFCAFALLVPPLWVGLTKQETIVYFSDPWMIGSVALCFLVYLFTNVITASSTYKNLTSFEIWRARWALLNGIIIHCYLDAGIGVFQLNKTLSQQYHIIDKRFADKGPYGNTLHVISFLELLIPGPLGVWLYWAFYKGKSYRSTLEVLFSAIQLYGTLLWLLEDHSNGYKSFTWIDYELEFTLNHIFYFWFAIVLGMTMWIVIPVWLIYVAFTETQTISFSVAISGKLKNLGGKKSTKTN